MWPDVITLLHIQRYVSCGNRVHYRFGISVFSDLGVVAEKAYFSIKNNSLKKKIQ